MFFYYYKFYEDLMCFIRKVINEFYVKILIKRLYKKILMFDKFWYLKFIKLVWLFYLFFKSIFIFLDVF